MELTRFLVCYDYGMGGLWWWVNAESAEQIVLTLAEVHVVTDPRFADDTLPEVDLDGPLPPPLDKFRATRTEQRKDPRFGALAGRDRVYVRLPADDDPGGRWYAELGPDGRIVRQVMILGSGEVIRSDETELPINPPYDLWAPGIVDWEMDEAEFADIWAAYE
ncbi:hypothetical protein GCM10029964_047050 [Kibdelosporangium lantanae]